MNRDRFIMAEAKLPPVMVSVVVPMKDEEGSLPLLAREMGELAARLAERGDALEVILVDEGSPDGTVPAAQAWCAGEARRKLVSHRTNRGFGAGLRTGVAAST